MLPLLSWSGQAELPAGGNDAGLTARQLYRRGKVSLEAERYTEAIRSFTSLIDGFPSDPLVPAARKYRARADRAREKAAGDVKTRRMTQGGEQPIEKAKMVLRPLYPVEKPAPQPEPAGPVKGDPANCIPRDKNDSRRFCNWYDALAYCEGRLPTVIELQERNLAECPAGKRGGPCGGRHWSSEGDGSRAKTVIFGNGGEINSDKKAYPNIFVMCAGPARL